MISAREVRGALSNPNELVGRLGLADGAVKQQGGRGVIIRCPVHEDSKPSCSVTVGQDGTVRFKCFACDASGDALGLIAAAKGLNIATDFARVVDEAAALTGYVDWQAVEQTRRELPKPKPPKQLSPDEVDAFWSSLSPVLDDEEVCQWLREDRALDPEAIELWDLARVLPAGASAPPWAPSWGSRGHRLILQTWNAHGLLSGVRGRYVGKGKALAPFGVSSKGLMLADGLGVQLLQAGQWPEWCTRQMLIVTEGEPDFLTWATRFSDADEQAPAVWGIPGSGAWTKEIGDRVPSGSQVVIRTDDDEQGNKYAAEILSQLSGRCEVFR